MPSKEVFNAIARVSAARPGIAARVGSSRLHDGFSAEIARVGVRFLLARVRRGGVFAVAAGVARERVRASAFAR